MTNPMTPERIEELKGRFKDIAPEELTFISVGELHNLLAALEESQQQKVELWECEDCGFAFPAMYEDDTPEGGHSCPVCAETRLEKELVEAQQTIARQREALEVSNESICDLLRDQPNELWTIQETQSWLDIGNGALKSIAEVLGDEEGIDKA
ncbi:MULTISPECIES: hypothetical protein [Paenibacillus]|uniref:hypothetical protein n=1 Tax=Paenibacillus TaxID=44249 RepID=UPI00096F98BA|nr:hypothetical protein [Paenibacillus odorifer]OME09593.1 hypothetical protein BSK60_27545 [Paenibacillus odorifer]